MKIAAIIVTYNRKELLNQCLHAVLQQEEIYPDVILIDNASTDGTDEMVRKINDERIHYYNTGANLGGAGGFSFGVEKGVELGYDYCWIMDDDTIPNKNALSSLSKKINRINASYVCSRVVWKDGNACIMNTPPTGKRFSLYNQEALDLHLIEICGCSFVSCLVDMRVVKKVGLPIAEFFIYGDDVEFTRRLETIGKGYIDLDSVVLHAMPNNLASNIVYCENSRIERYKFGVRNGVYISRKYDKKNVLKILLDMMCTAMTILLKSKESKFKRISVLLKSTIKGIFFNPSIRYVTTS